MEDIYNFKDAFKSLESLEEDAFSVDKNGVQKLKDYLDSDEEDTSISVIDADAETEEELKKSYVGKVILDCNVCHSKIYKDKDDIVIEEDEESANIGEECPYCYSVDGYKIVGEVAEYCDDCEEKEEKDEVEVKETEETEEEETDESLTESKKKCRRCKNEGYRGSEDVEFVSNGMWSDPDLVYKGYTFNYWDIEDALWSEFLEETGHKDSESGDPAVESEFDEYVQGRVTDYLDDVIYGGYFEKGSKSWHDRYKKESCKNSIKNEGLTSAQRYNRTLDRIWEGKKAFDRKFAEFLRKNGYTDEQIKSLEDDDELNYEIATKFGHDAVEKCVREVAAERKNKSKKEELKKKPVKEDLSYGELVSISQEWEKFKKDTGRSDAGSAREFIEKNFGKAYNDEEKEDIFGYISTLEEELKKKPVKESRSLHETYLSQQDLLDTLTGNVKASAQKIADTQKRKYGNDEVWSATIYDAKNGVSVWLGENESRAYPEYVNGKVIVATDARSATAANIAKALYLQTFGDPAHLYESKPVKEDFKDVTITTDDTHMEMTSDENGKVTVTTEPIKKEEKEDSENIVVPVSDEAEKEIEDNQEDEVDVDFDEFDEESFDELGESYLKRVYGNVSSFNTSKVTADDTKVMVEGVIKFESGKEKRTSFVFESKNLLKGNRVRFIGENLQITRGKKAFNLTGSISGKKFVAESFNYNYKQKDNNGNSKRVYGTVFKKK